MLRLVTRFFETFGEAFCCLCSSWVFSELSIPTLFHYSNAFHPSHRNSNNETEHVRMMPNGRRDTQLFFQRLQRVRLGKVSIDM